MNANLNMTTYRNNVYRTSDDIRREYLQNTRRREMISLLRKTLAKPSVRKAIVAVKAIIAIACAIALFSVLGSIEAGNTTALSGILYALVIAAVECICFIPTAELLK